MSEQEVDQTEAAAARDDEAAASAADPADSGGDAGDSEMAKVVDQRAQERTGEAGGADDATAGDPIAQAEAHLASVDMDEQRRTVEEISKDM
jgi:hypothetical protein